MLRQMPGEGDQLRHAAAQAVAAILLGGRHDHQPALADPGRGLAYRRLVAAAMAAGQNQREIVSVALDLGEDMVTLLLELEEGRAEALDDGDAPEETYGKAGTWLGAEKQDTAVRLGQSQ